MSKGQNMNTMSEFETDIMAEILSWSLDVPKFANMFGHLDKWVMTEEMINEFWNERLN